MRRPLGSVALLLGIACSLVFAGGASAAFPGTNGRITYVSNRDGNDEIYTAKADGSDPKRLTANLVDDADPAYSPDGTKILFTRGNDIWVMNADGTGQAAVTGIEGPDSEPGWSRDGTQIVYVSNQTAPGGGTTGPELFVRNLDGSGLRRVTDTPVGASRMPVWSPTADTIAYESNSDGSFEIYTIPASTTAGTGTRRSANEVGQGYQNPSWSPGGARIAFERGTGTNVGDATKEIWVMDADGTDPVQLTSNGVYDAQPAFSPDGNKLAFETNADGDLEINTMDAGPLAPGTNISNTTSGITDGQPDWAKDVPPPEPPPTGGGGEPGGGGQPGGGDGGSKDGTAPSCNQTVGFGTLQAIGCFTDYKGGWLSSGNLWINGIAFIAGQGGQLWINPKDKKLESIRGVFEVRAEKSLIKSGTINWTLTEVVGGLLAEFQAGAGSQFGGLQAEGRIKVRLLRGAVAQVVGAARMRFMELLQRLCGKDCPLVTADVTMMTDNKTGLQTRGLTFKARNVQLGIIRVESIDATWVPAQGDWEADGAIVFQSLFPFKANVHWLFDGNRLIEATASLRGVRTPLSNIVFLKSLDLALHTQPTPQGDGAITTTAGPTIGGSPLLQNDGSFAMALGPNGFIKAGGAISILGFPVAQGHFEWYPSSAFSFGAKLQVSLQQGSFVQGSGGSLEISAGLEGWASRSVVGAEGSAVVKLHGATLARAEMVLSQIGWAACGQIGWFRVGAARRYASGGIVLMAGGCDVAPYRAVKSAHAAQSGPMKLNLRASGAGTLLRFRGNGGAPKVILDGPHGQHVAASADGSPVKSGTAVVLQDPDGAATHVALRKPAGRWTVTTAAGSPPIAGVDSADIMEPPAVSARVAGHGSKRTLTWKLMPRPGQRVTFTEVGRDASAVIAKTSAARGRARFTSAPGNARARRIVATIEQSGVPRDSVTVARYTAPAWKKPAKPRKLRARRSGSNLIVTWGAAAGAARYAVYVTASDGDRELFIAAARNRRLKVRDIQKNERVLVKLQGLRADGKPGRAATLRVRPAGRRALAGARARTP